MNEIDRYKHQIRSSNEPLFRSSFYSVLTSKLLTSPPLGDFLDLVMRQLRQECVRQVHARNLLSTKLFHLHYSRFTLPQVGLPQDPSNVHCFFLTTTGHECVRLHTFKRHGCHSLVVYHSVGMFGISNRINFFLQSKYYCKIKKHFTVQ